MHETVFASSILRIVEEEAAIHLTGDKSGYVVEEIVLQVGILACLEETTLRGCFEIMAEETVARGARLVIERLPLRGICPDCDPAHKEVRAISRKFTCPRCGGANVDWQGGNEMNIAAIKVKEESIL
jgi:hydrogenase nickel incorporation protein HypA/HybF